MMMRTLVLYIMLPDTTIIPCVKCLLKQGQVGSHVQSVGMGILEKLYNILTT